MIRSYIINAQFFFIFWLFKGINLDNKPRLLSLLISEAVLQFSRVFSDSPAFFFIFVTLELIFHMLIFLDTKLKYKKDVMNLSLRIVNKFGCGIFQKHKKNT